MLGPQAVDLLGVGQDGPVLASLKAQTGYPSSIPTPSPIEDTLFAVSTFGQSRASPIAADPAGVTPDRPDYGDL